jgi:hypothetical protein
MSDHASLLDLAAELGRAMTPRDKHRFARAGTNHRVGYSTVYLSFYHRLRFRSGVQAFLVDPITCAFCHHGRSSSFSLHRGCHCEYKLWVRSIGMGRKSSQLGRVGWNAIPWCWCHFTLTASITFSITPLQTLDFPIASASRRSQSHSRVGTRAIAISHIRAAAKIGNWLFLSLTCARYACQ